MHFILDDRVIGTIRWFNTVSHMKHLFLFIFIRIFPSGKNTTIEMKQIDNALQRFFLMRSTECALYSKKTEKNNVNEILFQLFFLLDVIAFNYLFVMRF